MKSRGENWTEKEIQSTIIAYFKLLGNQNKKIPTIKMDYYRELSNQFPSRSCKSFEAKFQNISAILYELNQSYCTGLKPRFNYQNLLKLLVLDHLKKNPQPQIEPYKILIEKIQDLAMKKNIPVIAKGTGRFGLSIENQLGIKPNSDKAPDFMGIELKTKFGMKNQTLFSRTPCVYYLSNGKESLISDYGYFDERKNRTALYTSFNNTEDTLGFLLLNEMESISIYNKNKKILEYSLEKIEEALLSKHSQSLFIELDVSKTDEIETFSIKNATYCKWPSILRFKKLLDMGRIFLNFTLSKKNGKIKDHGFLWKIDKIFIEELFLFSETVNLEK